MLAEDVPSHVDLDMVVSGLLSAAHVFLGLCVCYVEDGLASEICLRLVQRCLLFLIEMNFSVDDFFYDVRHVLDVAVHIDVLIEGLLAIGLVKLVRFVQLHELCVHQLLYAGPVLDFSVQAGPDKVLCVVARVQPLCFFELEVLGLL